MKRLLFTIPLVLLFLLNACANDPAGISPALGTAVAQTQTATMWTITPTQTRNPYATTMIERLNTDLHSSANSLESTMDADYSVNDISFPYIPDSSNLLFRVDVNCTCRESTGCCIPERTFVVIIESMRRTSLRNIVYIPVEVRQIMVVCSDTENNSQLGAVSASWQNVDEYLQGYLLGYQLGMQVTRTLAP